ncbi:hypothetical protein AR691_13470 [Bacillus amyloliquefaciens]|nr:hypothetical protein AR691_13470 [Bacillus amyloliquefaciens]
MLKVKHYFKDEFGQETETVKTCTEDAGKEIGDIEFQINSFIRHLETCGYTGRLIRDELQSASRHIKVES